MPINDKTRSLISVWVSTLMMVGTTLFIGNALIKLWCNMIGLPLFGAIESNDFYDILAILIFILFTIYSLVHTHKISKQLSLLFLLYTIVYVELRFSINTNSYSLVRFHNSLLKSICYADIIPLSMLVYVVSALTGTKRKSAPENSNILYFEDKSNVTDLLDNKTTAEILAKLIRTDYRNRENAVGIAVTGEWGTGKSTFLEFLNESLDDCVRVKFDPWTENSNDITSDLLHKIEEGVKEEDRHAARLLRRYIDKLNVTNVTGWFGLCLLTLKNFFDSDSTDEYKERLRVALTTLVTPVVIFIDDSDRLPPDQFLKTISLIRGVADLPNVVFIVAYDQDRANEMLRDYGGEGFMRKLFNVIHPLRPIDERIIKKEVCRNLCLIVSGEKMDPSVYSAFEETIGNVGVKRYIPTLREMKRFCNVIEKDFSLIKDREILHFLDLRQWALIELLKYSDIATYTFLAAKPELYLKKEEPFSLNSPYYVMRSDARISTKESEHLLRQLFPEEIGLNTDTYLISNPHYFHLYFGSKLPETYLPHTTEDRFVILSNDSEEIAKQKAEDLRMFIRENWKDSEKSNIEPIVCEILKSYSAPLLYPILETIVEEFLHRKSIKTFGELSEKDEYRKYAKIVRNHIFIPVLSFMSMEDFCSFKDHEAVSDECILNTKNPLIHCAILNQHIKRWDYDGRIGSDGYLFYLLKRLAKEGAHRDVIWAVADCISLDLPKDFLIEYTETHFLDYLPYLLWWKEKQETGERRIYVDINAIESLFLSYNGFKSAMNRFARNHIADEKLLKELRLLVDLSQLRDSMEERFRADHFPLLSKYLLDEQSIISEHYLESETFWTGGNRLECIAQYELV